MNLSARRLTGLSAIPPVAMWVWQLTTWKPSQDEFTPQISFGSTTSEYIHMWSMTKFCGLLGSHPLVFVGMVDSVTPPIWAACKIWSLSVMVCGHTWGSHWNLSSGAKIQESFNQVLVGLCKTDVNSLDLSSEDARKNQRGNQLT